MRTFSPRFSVTISVTIIFLLAGVTSILFSIWNNLNETVINPDAICYILSADAIAQSGWKAIMQTCPQAHWAFYSMLIYSVAHLFSLSSLYAAYGINGFFSLVSVITFIALVREMGGNKKILCFAALTILCFHEFNVVRQYIVRDHGFWTFYLISIFFLFRYFRYERLFYAIGFYFSLILATLFRIEGAIFLLLLPMASWWIPDFTYKKRFYYFLILTLPLILIFITLLIYLQHHLGRVNEVMLQLQHGVHITLSHFEDNQLKLAKYILKQDAVRNAGLFLFLALTVWYGFYIIISLSLGYALLLVYGLYNKNIKNIKINLINKLNKRILIFYIIINIGITFIYFVQQMFLSKRYLVALSLTLMLFIPFIIDDLVKKWRAQKNARVILSISILLILISAIGSLIHFGHSKKYIKEAGDWLSHHVQNQEKLYTNDLQLMFYSKYYKLDIFKILPVFKNQNILLKENWRQYDYIALRINQRDEFKSIQQLPEKVFNNKRGDRVVIYHNLKNPLYMKKPLSCQRDLSWHDRVNMSKKSGENH
jgi:hypothetical protein